MEQEALLKENSHSRTDAMTPAQLAQEVSVLRTELEFAMKEIYKLREQKLSDKQLNLILEEQLASLRSEMFGASSEKYKKPEAKEPKLVPAAPRIKKPSERYPNLPVRDVVITVTALPTCDACGNAMSDSGMTEESQQISVIPKKFEIINYIRPKFRCSCHGCIKTTPMPPRIIEGSSYSDEMILDVALSKYCDLIPMERYSAMAAREGVMDLPPHSLIELTHGLSDFLRGTYDLIRSEVAKARVLHADETTHNMMEGSDKKSWYLWGFSTSRHCFFECHGTRSGDVASEILKSSKCEVLISDVYYGYSKAIKDVNKIRLQNQAPLLQNAKCNAHARRYFFKSRDHYPGAEFYLEEYHQLYRLNAESKGKSNAEILELRNQMRPRYELMKAKAELEQSSYPSKNKYWRALNYFLENYEGLILFLDQPDVAIDNNSQERLLRSPVVGRKTWYGTHSQRGAETAAILFSLIESCKLVGVNPREYFKNLVQDLHAGKNPYTPNDFKDLKTS